MSPSKKGPRQPWLSRHCLSNPGAVKEFKEEWQAYRYLIGGKMFAMEGCDGNGDDIITLKLKPEDGDFLRHQYGDISPGYYMNKLHWNSVRRDGDVPDDVLRDMLDRSYSIVLGSLPKKTRDAISGAEPVKAPAKTARPEKEKAPGKSPETAKDTPVKKSAGTVPDGPRKK